jgi:hypothetical protein
VDLVLEASHDAFVPTSSAAFRVVAGEAKAVDVALRRGARLVGRAVDARGRGVADARVRFGHVAPEDEGALRDSFRADQLLSPRTFAADAGGSFVVDRVPPGKTLLKVEAEGFAPWYRKDLQAPVEGDLSGLTATLEGALTIAGRVAVDGTGAPVAGAWVVALSRPAEGAPPDDGAVRRVVSGETASDGTYVLEKVPPGTFDVVVWIALGYATGDREPSSRREGTAAGSRGVDFRLKPVVASGPPGG